MTIEAELVMRQGEGGVGLGSVGTEEAGTIGMGAASDGEGQPEDAVESGDGAEVVVIGTGPVLTLGTVDGEGSQGPGTIRLRARALAHRKPPLMDSYLLSTN